MSPRVDGRRDGNATPGCGGRPDDGRRHIQVRYAPRGTHGDDERRRREAKEAYDAYLAACQTHRLLDRISDKWVGLVLGALRDGPRRHSELAARIAGVSQKMLTLTLRALERDGLVARTVTPSVPVRVDCELTAPGLSLRERLDVLAA